MIRKLLCWLGWHEAEYLYEQKQLPDNFSLSERDLRILFEGFCDVWKVCKHCKRRL